MAYKKLIKVGNVCQVLDKRTYPATGTKNGITFTNNGDGSYTANGTITEWLLFYVCSINQLNNGVKLFANHKYLVLNGTYYAKNIYSVWLIVNNSRKAESNTDDNKWSFYTPQENTEAEIAIYIGTNTVGETVNFTVKPQLFDLTEMYGAGHEPTSVEQFRQDFPEEMYDYSPYCWLNSYKRVFMTGGGNYLTSYKTSLVCKTKNLFDISKVKETDTFKVEGNSIYSYSYPYIDTSTLIIFKSLKPNTNYTMSAITNYLGNSSTNITLIFNNGDWLNVLEGYKSGFVQDTFSLTQEQIDNIKVVYFYGKSESEGGPVIWSNIQIEEGNTATDYVPYGHL